jgi:hypothetical protein
VLLAPNMISGKLLVTVSLCADLITPKRLNELEPAIFITTELNKKTKCCSRPSYRSHAQTASTLQMQYTEHMTICNWNVCPSILERQRTFNGISKLHCSDTPSCDPSVRFWNVFKATYNCANKCGWSQQQATESNSESVESSLLPHKLTN